MIDHTCTNNIQNFWPSPEDILSSNTKKMGRRMKNKQGDPEPFESLQLTTKAGKRKPDTESLGSNRPNKKLKNVSNKAKNRASLKSKSAVPNSKGRLKAKYHKS